MAGSLPYEQYIVTWQGSDIASWQDGRQVHDANGTIAGDGFRDIIPAQSFLHIAQGACVYVDNPTALGLYWPESGVYIGPFSTNVLRSFPSPQGQAHVQARIDTPVWFVPSLGWQITITYFPTQQQAMPGMQTTQLYTTIQESAGSNLQTAANDASANGGVGLHGTGGYDLITPDNASYQPARTINTRQFGQMTLVANAATQVVSYAPPSGQRWRLLGLILGAVGAAGSVYATLYEAGAPFATGVPMPGAGTAYGSALWLPGNGIPALVAGSALSVSMVATVAMTGMATLLLYVGP